MSLIDAAGWDAMCPPEKEETRPAFTPGEKVWIVERDEDGNAIGVACLLFLAEVADTIIVTPKVYGCKTLKSIMAYHVDETAKDFGVDLAVFPADDCYLSRCEANFAFVCETGDIMEDETEDDDG